MGLQEEKQQLQEKNVDLEEKNAGLQEEKQLLQEKNVDLEEKNAGLQEEKQLLQKEKQREAFWRKKAESVQWVATGDAWKGKTGVIKHTFAKGDCYIGDIVDGQWHGRGIKTWANGDRYEGAWKDDK